MTDIDKSIYDQLLGALLSILPHLRERPEMICGSEVGVESYLFAYDHIAERLCGEGFYRKFLFESNFGSLTFNSQFQSARSCTIGLRTAYAEEGLESEYSERLERHLMDFEGYLKRVAS